MVRSLKNRVSLFRRFVKWGPDFDSALGDRPGKTDVHDVEAILREEIFFILRRLADAKKSKEGTAEDVHGKSSSSREG